MKTFILNTYKIITLLLITLFCFTIGSFAEEKDIEKVEILFVQNSEDVSFKKGSPTTVTLKNAGPNTIFFSDKPARIAGHLSNEGFLKVWNEQTGGFKDVPPNASISVVNGKVISDVIVELSNPRIDGKDITYDINIIKGEIPKNGGVTALFIDGIWASAGIGAAGGALVGAISGNTVKGAAIGAAAGGLFGLGEEHQKHKEDQ
ncbi:MAG: YMGG-like glycine zipper-containing protein [Thermodesulfobacteriota bacterium]